jgi:hypothetical protein
VEPPLWPGAWRTSGSPRVRSVVKRGAKCEGVKVGVGLMSRGVRGVLRGIGGPFAAA